MIKILKALMKIDYVKLKTFLEMNYYTKAQIIVSIQTNKNHYNIKKINEKIEKDNLFIKSVENIIIIILYLYYDYNINHYFLSVIYFLTILTSSIKKALMILSLTALADKCPP
jgi:hypothetical protein